MVKKNRNLLVFMTVGLGLMLILRDIYGVGLNKFLYFALVVGCMVVADYQTLVDMVCFILPLVCGLPGTYIMPCAVLLLIVKRGKLRLMSIVLVICLSLLEVAASFWYPSSNVPDLVQYISFMAVVILLIHDPAELDYEEAIRIYLYGTMLLCGVIVWATLQTAPRNWLDLFARGMFRFGAVDKNTDSAMALSLNANSLAYYSITGITCGILLAERRKGPVRVLYIAMAVFAAVTGFFTISRSWILIVALVLLLYILSKLRSLKQFLALVLVVVLLVLAFVVLINNNPTLLEGFITRFTEEDVETGNNRNQIFSKYMEYYFSNPRYILFGTGVTQYHAVLENAGSIHNGSQQVLVCTGFLGFVLYLFALGGPVLQARRQGKRPFIEWLPLLSVVAFVQTIQFLSPMMLMLPYIIGVYALKAGGQKNEIISDNRGHGGGRSLGLETR